MSEVIGQFTWWLFHGAETRPGWTEIIPVISIVLSAGVAMYVMLRNQRFTREQATRSFGESVMPCLVFSVEVSDRNEHVVVAANVGKGAAVNIRIELIEDGSGFQTSTVHPVPALTAGGQFTHLMRPQVKRAHAAYSNVFDDFGYITDFTVYNRMNVFKATGKRTPGESRFLEGDFKSITEQ